jgi:hypothetical protein
MTLGEKIYQAIMNINPSAEYVSTITSQENEEFEINWVNTTPISIEDIKAEMDKL